MASFSERYHEFSKYNPLSIDRLNQVDWSAEPTPFKGDVGEAILDLTPWLQHFTSLDPHQPHQEFGPTDKSHVCSPEFIASLFFQSAGITAAMQTEKGPFYFRANPSAGGIYPNETYLLASSDFKLEDQIFKKGEIFHYQPLNNCLFATEMHFQPEKIEEMFHPPESCEFIILISTIHERGSWRYGERAYRRELLDTGHLTANFQLYLQSKGKSLQHLGIFDDSQLMTELAWETEFPLLALAIFNSQSSLAPSVGRSAHHQEAIGKISQDKTLSFQQCQIEAQFGAWEPNHLLHDEKPLSDLTQHSETRPITHHTIGDLNQIPIEMLRRRSARNFHPSPDRQGVFDKFSQIIDFSLSHHPLPLSGSFLNSFIIYKGDEKTPTTLYQLDAKHKIWIKKNHALRWDDLQKVALGQDLAHSSSCALFHTADLGRAVEVFGDRAYRYLSIDAGIYGQLMQIAAIHMGFGTTGVGGYYDNLCNELLNIPMNEAIIYLTLLGTPLDS